MIVVALVIFLLGVGAVFFMKYSGDTEKSTTESISLGNSSESSDSQSVSGTFMDLLALGESYQCTFETVDESGNQTSGMVYVAGSGDKLRGEFTINTPEDTTYDAYILRDGTYNYLWSSQEPQGFKTAISEEDEGLFSDDKEGNTGYGVDDEANVDFNCDKWRVDNSKFVPPSDVEFTDFSQMMQNVTDEVTQSTNLDCSVCDQVPEGQARTQCLTTLGC